MHTDSELYDVVDVQGMQAINALIEYGVASHKRHSLSDGSVVSC